MCNLYRYIYCSYINQDILLHLMNLHIFFMYIIYQTITQKPLNWNVIFKINIIYVLCDINHSKEDQNI